MNNSDSIYQYQERSNEDISTIEMSWYESYNELILIKGKKCLSQLRILVKRSIEDGL